MCSAPRKKNAIVPCINTVSASSRVSIFEIQGILISMDWSYRLSVVRKQDAREHLRPHL